MGCAAKVYWDQLREVERALKTMRTFGIPEISDAYAQLYSIRGDLLRSVGLGKPRIVTQIARLVGRSPGTFAVWHDLESGWMAEARAKPGAPPVYKRVDDQTAMAILQDRLTPELEARLLAPPVDVDQ
jgi:hypothetical protein